MSDIAGEKKDLIAGIAVTAGTFDGVHRGHSLVLSTLRSEARRRGLRPVAITFDPHPLAVIAPGREPKLLESVERRLERLRAAGVEAVAVPFTDDVRRLTAAQWMARLRDGHGARLVVAGYDNTFGSDCRGMCPGDYARLGSELGLEVVVAPEAPGVCSSAIRSALAAGDISAANDMLGYEFELSGTVVHGRHLGTGLGFPTANLAVAPGLQLPAPGVYAARAYGAGGTGCGNGCPAVVNIGDNPTIGPGNPVTVEAHLLGYGGDLYGRRLTLRFVARLRGERRFSGLDALKAQIDADVRAVRGMMSGQSG